MPQPSRSQTHRPIHFNRVLHEQTLEYWRVSQVWNGVSSECFSVGEALDILRHLAEKVNPARPIAKQLFVLRDNIVIHGTKASMVKGKQHAQAQSASVTFL